MITMFFYLFGLPSLGLLEEQTLPQISKQIGAFQLNLVDIELGRNFWTSHYLAIRPHVGIRVAYLEQDYDIEHAGGNWGAINASSVTGYSWGPQTALNNSVHLDNDFKGVGLRSGLDSTWNLGCGWALYGDFAASIVYGTIQCRS